MAAFVPFIWCPLVIVQRVRVDRPRRDEAENREKKKREEKGTLHQILDKHHKLQENKEGFG